MLVDMDERANCFRYCGSVHEDGGGATLTETKVLSDRGIPGKRFAGAGVPGRAAEKLLGGRVQEFDHGTERLSQAGIGVTALFKAEDARLHELPRGAPECSTVSVYERQISHN